MHAVKANGNVYTSLVIVQVETKKNIHADIQQEKIENKHKNTYTHTRLTALFPGLPR